MSAVRGTGAALARGAGPVLAVVALLTAVALFIRFGGGNAIRLASPDMRVHVDFDTFWRSTVALRQHRDLYRTGAELANLNPTGALAAGLAAPC
jgi:hypothetical protein